MYFDPPKEVRFARWMALMRYFGMSLDVGFITGWEPFSVRLQLALFPVFSGSNMWK